MNSISAAACVHQCQLVPFGVCHCRQLAWQACGGQDYAGVQLRRWLGWHSQQSSASAAIATSHWRQPFSVLQLCVIASTHHGLSRHPLLRLFTWFCLLCGIWWYVAATYTLCCSCLAASGHWAVGQPGRPSLCCTHGTEAGQQSAPHGNYGGGGQLSCVTPQRKSHVPAVCF